MAAHTKLAGFFAFLLVILLPSFALAKDIHFSVSPAEIHIDNLQPGETAQFELTILNKEELTHNFSIAAFQPSEEERREGRAEFPDDSWISLSSPEIEVPAKSEVNVTVAVTIPQEQKWAGGDWEIWLGITTETADLLAVQLYTRVLVSTIPAVGARSNTGLIAGVVVGATLLGCGSYYYFRRRTRYE
jgi:hypothetical protein